MTATRDVERDMILTPPFPPDALATAYTRYHKFVTSRIHELVGHAPALRERVPDLTQDTFLKAHRALPRVEARAIEQQKTLLVKPWLSKMGTNVAIDELRRNQLVQWLSIEKGYEVFQQDYAAPDNPPRDAIQSEERDLVRQVISRLHPRHRFALQLSLEGLSHEEIGEILGLNRIAAKSLLYRASLGFREEYCLTYGSEFDF